LCSDRNNKLHDRTSSDISKKNNRIPTTIISSPTSTMVCINAEVSNDYQNCMEESMPVHFKKKKCCLNTKSINFDQRKETHFRPLTANQIIHYKQFLLNKSHSNKSIPNFITQNFEVNNAEKKKIQGNKINKNQEIMDYVEKIKTMVFYTKNEEIINNLKFFEKMKDSCKLNFFSVFEGCKTTTKTKEPEYKNEDLYNLILLNLKKLETDVFYLFLVKSS